MKMFKFLTDRAYFLRLEYGKDIISQLIEFLEKEKIRVAFVSAIGAVKSAEIGYYDQIRKDYINREINEACEIISLTGNVSIKDGKPFPHLHVVLGYDSKVYCGHLFKAEVFACEVFVLALDTIDKIPNRKFDGVTGLYLWD